MTRFLRHLTFAFRLQLLLMACWLAGCSALRRGDPPVDRSDDVRIQQEVESRLAREPAIAESRVRVQVEGRIVILHGSVRGLSGWQCAIRIATLVPDVRSVTDYLVIERASEAQPCIAERTAPSSNSDGRRSDDYLSRHSRS